MRAADRPTLAITAAGALAGLLMIVSEFLTVASVDVAHGSCQVINDANPSLADRCTLSGLERHGGAFILIGLLALLMAWGAGVGRSRPAGAGLPLARAPGAGDRVGDDLPRAHQPGAPPRDLEGAKATGG